MSNSCSSSSPTATSTPTASLRFYMSFSAYTTGVEPTRTRMLLIERRRHTVFKCKVGKLKRPWRVNIYIYTNNNGDGEKLPHFAQNSKPGGATQINEWISDVEGSKIIYSFCCEEGSGLWSADMTEEVTAVKRRTGASQLHICLCSQVHSSSPKPADTATLFCCKCILNKRSLASGKEFDVG